jgi:CDP-4-dehydro-6-deoxyglucose reductase
MNLRVSLANSDRSFSVVPNQSVLDAALRAGINLPHSCRGGNCGSCRARLIAGKITYPNGPPLGLSEAEVADGFVLLCHARAQSDLLLQSIEVGAADRAIIKRLPARIERFERLTHDVIAVFLRLPAAESFDFEPGQYIDILLAGGRRRSFSIASPPHDARLLELHIRHVPGGKLTDGLFARDPRGMLLSIEGPLGHFVYRESAAPMLMVGGGTGFAPLKSMLRHSIENRLQREITLYWGVRSERDLYWQYELEALAKSVPKFRYQVVLSDPGPDWRGKRGWVHEVAMRDIQSLDGYDIYASGPPEMISRIRADFGLAGASAERLFFDSFDYALDMPARQDSMADTKS